MPSQRFHVMRNRGGPFTGRSRSPQVWRDFPVESVVNGEIDGIYMHDDFTAFPHLTTPTITTEAAIMGRLGYKAFGSSGGTILPTGARYGGVVLTESDDNEGVGLATIALPFQLDFNLGLFCFEARLKTNEVANTKHGFFCGLVGAQTLSATVPIAAAGTLADLNLVGFHRLEGDGDQLDTVYKANGVTQVTVKADAISTTAGVHTDAGSLAADTYINLGMRFDPKDNYLRFFINNIELPDKKQLPQGMGDGDDFPNDVPMGLCLAMLCASGDDAIVTLQQWRAGQLGDTPI